MRVTQLLSLRSSVRKIGAGVVCTHRPVGPTCDPTCPLLDAGCYAQRGNEHLVQLRSADRHDQLGAAAGAPLIRHLVSGDVMRRNARGHAILDLPYLRQLFDFHRRWRRSIGWMYTHAWRRWSPELRSEIPSNLTVLASCDSIDGAKEAQALGWRTARVTENLGDRQRGETVCPYDAAPRGQRTITCTQCRKCWETSRNILFLKLTR